MQGALRRDLPEDHSMIQLWNFLHGRTPNGLLFEYSVFGLIFVDVLCCIIGTMPSVKVDPLCPYMVITAL